jgi:hypothetical protein
MHPPTKQSTKGEKIWFGNHSKFLLMRSVELKVIKSTSFLQMLSVTPECNHLST